MGEQDGTGKISRRGILQSGLGIAASTALANSASASSSVDTTTQQQGFGPELIEQDEAAGFNFPYYLYAPANGRDKPPIVEAVNSGSPSDDMQDHIDAAEQRIQRGISRTMSDTYGVPYLVPIIKDPRSGVAGRTRTQSLDTETMEIESGRYARIDQQVVRMVDDARDRLADSGYDLPEEFMLNGFSQSGNFANNLALLQPERIASVTGGGLNGMAILPRDTAAGEQIDFQIGTNDYEAITGKEFDREAWREIPQMGYIGANERKPTDDTIPWSDVWTDRDQARRAVDVYGFDMQRERMVYSDVIHQQEGAKTRFEVYDNAGHDNSRPQIMRDAIGFNARHVGIPYAFVSRGLVADADEIELDVFVPEGNSETQEVRAFVNGSDATEGPVRIRRGESNRITLSLTSTLEIDDQVEIAVFNPGDTALDDALYTDSRQIEFGMSFSTPPEPGDTSIEVDYEAGNSRVRMNLLTDSGALYWQRRARLGSVTGSGTETFEFSNRDEGVPFEAGDELELQARVPGEPTGLRGVFDRVTVGDPATYDPATQAVGEVTHDDVEVAFGSPPTIGSTTIDVECRVDESFDRDVGLRLFPETGTGRWGIDSDWDFDPGWKSFPSIGPGQTVADEYDVPSITFAPADRPALGSSVELRAYPDNWGRLSDFVASTKAIISGIRFKRPPMAGSDTVSIKYLYPDTFEQTGQIQLEIAGEEIETVNDIEPGVMDSHEFAIDTEDITVTDEITVSISPTGGSPFDNAEETAVPADAGSVSFETAPDVLADSISLDYHLDTDYETDRFALLRLYTEETSSWGAYVDQVNPGKNATETIDINPEEVCVPFRPGTEVTVKLVDWDDPYGTMPLDTASAVVGGIFAHAGDEQTVEPGASVTLDATESSGTTDQSLSYTWRQVEGPEVTLDGAETATPTFAAPHVDNRSVLVFEVTVDDGERTDTATTTVNVSPDNDSSDETDDTDDSSDDDSNDETDDTDNSSDNNSSDGTDGTDTDDDPSDGTDDTDNSTDDDSSAETDDTDTDDNSSDGTDDTDANDSPDDSSDGTDDTDDGPDDRDDAGDDTDDDNNSSATESENESGPGFGVTSGLASIGGVAYLLKRRLAGTEDTEKQ